MGKLDYKTSEFDAAIRKVRADYASVTNVTATASDVVKGKTIMNAQKELITGTLENADITPNFNINSSVIGETESNYPVSVTPSVNVSKAGYLSAIENGATVTKYIKTETKTVTPSSKKQIINASFGKLIDEVEVGACSVSAVLQNYYISKCTLSKPISKTQLSYGAYVPSGSKHNNVYCSSEDAASGKAKVYLFRIGETINDNNLFEIVDTNTKNIPDTTIVLSPGDSVVSSGNTYSPAGTLTFTTEGRLQFTHSTNFYCMYGSGSYVFLLYIDGYYYIPCVDYKIFDHAYNGVGSYSRTSTGNYQGYVNIVRGDTPVNFYRPKTLFANLTNVYFYFYWNKTTNYEPLRMTFNYGLYEGFFVEGDE